MRARQWAPELGVFLAVDEFSFHDVRNTLWGRLRQNPAASLDPSGHVRLARMTIRIDERARLAAAIAGRPTPSSALPQHVRRDAIAYTQRRVAQGASQAAVARELAVTTMTVSRWLSMARSTTPKLRPVRVVDSPRRRISGSNRRYRFG